MTYKFGTFGNSGFSLLTISTTGSYSLDFTQAANSQYIAIIF